MIGLMSRLFVQNWETFCHLHAVSVDTPHPICTYCFIPVTKISHPTPIQQSTLSSYNIRKRQLLFILIFVWYHNSDPDSNPNPYPALQWGVNRTCNIKQWQWNRPGLLCHVQTMHTEQCNGQQANSLQINI